MAIRARSSSLRPWTTCSATTPPPAWSRTGCTSSWPPPTSSTPKPARSCGSPTPGRCAASPSACSSPLKCETPCGPAPHTRREAAFAGALPGCPEIWLYLRGLGTRRELVCKVFDCYRGWRHGSAPSAARVPAQAVAGRGLQIVHELSRGLWGHHLTRARLGGWGVRGKAVWFAVPAPLAHARLVDVTGLHAYTLSADVTATSRASECLSARQVARELEAMLDERGFGGRLVRADQPASDMSVLSVCRGLTVWCRSGVVSMTSPEGDRERWSYADLVEAAEQTVRRYEELEPGLDLAAAGA